MAGWISAPAGLEDKQGTSPSSRGHLTSAQDQRLADTCQGALTSCAVPFSVACPPRLNPAKGELVSHWAMGESEETKTTLSWPKKNSSPNVQLTKSFCGRPPCALWIPFQAISLGSGGTNPQKGQRARFFTAKKGRRRGNLDVYHVNAHNLLAGGNPPQNQIL